MASLIEYASDSASANPDPWKVKLPAGTFPGWLTTFPNWISLVKSSEAILSFEENLGNKNQQLYFFNIDDRSNKYGTLTQAGRGLVRDFYEIKSEASISVPMKNGKPMDDDDFLKEIQNFIAKLPSVAEQPNLRHTWACSEKTTHSMPISYIRETVNEETKSWILVADSLGGKYPPETKDLNQVANSTGCKVHAVKTNLQASYGCRSYTIAFGIAIGRKNISGDYSISTSSLFDRGVQLEGGVGTFEARLPNVLMKWTQLSESTAIHAEPDSDPTIHHKKLPDGTVREENLQMFVKRHTNSHKKEQKEYLRMKTFSHISRLRIQYYLDRLSKDSAHPWTFSMKSAFIRQAKAVLRKSAEDHAGFSTENHEELNLDLDAAALANWLKDEGVIHIQ
jgi:hypothetical protein